MKSPMYFAIFLLVGCASNTIDSAVEHYNQNISSISLGMYITEFQSLFQLQQSTLSKMHTKPSERFTKNGDIYDIIYLRSARIPDGKLTDDEFTPHIFKNSKLAEIGWPAIGGMQRSSEDVAREEAEIAKARASATKIEQKIEQNTKVRSY